jgi:hypothetical protein
MYSIVFCSIRAYKTLCSLVKWFFETPHKSTISYYMLSDEYDSDDIDYERVPEDGIFIEEWVNEEGEKKCNLFYEGEEIVRNETNPFKTKPYVPWLWIGDKTTEVDLTSALQKYMVVGNTIQLDLILHMIQPHHDTEIMYIDTRTLEEVKFPDHGVRIVADDFTSK